MTKILTWCDDKVSYLKSHGIQFSSGVAVLPESSIYGDIPVMISTFRYRNDIPENLKNESLISFFMPEVCLWARLKKIDEEISILSQYGGIVGFDLSPSVGMLRPRQRFSIFINSLYNTYCALQGIKILPNSRLGDFGTMSMIDSIPCKSNIISGQLGCRKYGFKNYGILQIQQISEVIEPTILFIYGALSKSDATKLLSSNISQIITYPDRRNRVRNNAVGYCYKYDSGRLVKKPLSAYIEGGAA